MIALETGWLAATRGSNLGTAEIKGFALLIKALPKKCGIRPQSDQGVSEENFGVPGRQPRAHEVARGTRQQAVGAQRVGLIPALRSGLQSRQDGRHPQRLAGIQSAGRTIGRTSCPVCSGWP